MTPFSESRESKKVVSVTELLDQFKAETEPDAPQQPKWETVNGTGDSVLDKFSNVATWSDILMPLGRTEAKVQDSDTLEAWKRPGGTDSISAKSRKSRPAQSLSGQPTPAYHAGQTRNSTSQGLCAPALRQRPVGRV